MNKYDIITIILLFQGFSLNAQDFKFNYEHGKLCFKKGKLDSAIIYFNKAVEQNSNMIDLYLDRAGVYDATGKMSMALDDYNKIIEMMPLSGKAYQGRANVYMKIGQKEKEIQDYKKAIELLPDDKLTYYCYSNMGQQFIYDHGNIDTALYYLNKAIELTKKFEYNTASGTYGKRGDIFFQKEEYQKAIDDFTYAIGLDSTYYYHYLRRSDSYQKLGDKNKSKLDFIKYEQLKLKSDKKKKIQQPIE